MSGVRIVLSQALPAYHPGETVEGEVQWDFSEPESTLEVTLNWTTEAKTGSEDPEEVDSVLLDIAELKGTLPFRFVLPESPWSFEGRLFSVKWYLEVADYGAEARTEIVVSPTGQPIRPSVPA